MSGAGATSSKLAEEKRLAEAADTEAAGEQLPSKAAEEPAAKAAEEKLLVVDSLESPTAPPAAIPSTATLTAGTPPAATTTVPVLPAHHWTEAPDDGLDDNDSALGDGADSTASLSSSILSYRTIQGRTYHSEMGNAQYWGSNDEGHNESLDILHHVFTLALEGKLYLAPIKEPKKVLDVGTGTGIWAIDFADAFPGSDVIGTDVSPIQPTWVPPNLRFEIEDCTQEWTFHENEFDYIHIRYMVGSLTNWHALFKEAYRCLKPGGWFESYEGSPSLHCDNDTIPPTSALGQWGPLFINGGRQIGRSFTVVEEEIQRKAMEEAGFVDIQEKSIKVPSGSWPEDPRLKDMGSFSKLAVMQDAEGFILFMTNVLGWPRQQVDVFIAHLRKELRVCKYNYYYNQRVVWGRKPEL